MGATGNLGQNSELSDVGSTGFWGNLEQGSGLESPKSKETRSNFLKEVRLEKRLEAEEWGEC